MADSENTFPVEPGGVAVPIRSAPYLPPIVRDYPTQTIVNPVLPTIVNPVLPNPLTLDKANNASTRNLVLKTAKPGDAIPYVFGRTLVRPTVIGADDSGEYLVLDLMWSVGEVQRVCNGAVPSSAPAGTWDYALKFPDISGLKIISGGLYEHFLGTQTQSASSIMTALKGSYPAYPGIAHSVISMQLGWNLNVMGYVDGVKVIDPRVSPQLVWTRNPALILGDMLTRCGYTMDYTSVADAADYCDELVGAASPQIERWKISGEVYDRADLQSWIHAMAQYAHCFVDKSGSTFFLRPDKPRASNHTVTAADMLAGSARVKLRGGRNTVEGVRVTYAFASRTLDAEYGTLTDPGTITQLQMPFWRASFPYLGAHAKRHAEEVYRKSQLAVEELEFVSFDEGLNRTVGDVGTITNATVGLSAKEMTLFENQQIAPGRWRRRYTEYSASVYQDASYDLSYDDTELYNPYDPPPGPTPTLTQTTITDPESSAISSLVQVEFTGEMWAYVKSYYITATGDDESLTIVYDGELPHAGLVQHIVFTLPVVVGVTYTVNVYLRSIVDALSATPGTADLLIIDPDILWSDTPLTISNLDDGDDSIFYPQAIASITFWDAHYEFPDCTAATYQINPATFGSVRLISHDFLTGEYLVKYTIVPTASPAPAPPTVYVNGFAGQEGVWYDLYQAVISIIDTVDDETENTVVLDITVAKNDLASPQGAVTGTERTKRCTFISDYGNEPFVLEPFLQVNGTDIDTTTFFTTMFGDPEVQLNKAKGGSTASPAHSSGDHAAMLNDAWAIFADAKCQATFNVGAAMTGTFGLLGRQAAAPNAGNCFQLILTDCDTENPVLTMQEMSGTGAAMAVVADRGMVILTGEGPFNYGTGGYFSITMELECVGTSIVGRMWTPMIGIPYSISYTTSTYSTQTRWGFRISGVNDGWCDDFKVYALGPYPVTAKHLNPTASPGNYYTSTQYNGLIPASGSGDTFIDMTLVFCIRPNEYADAAVFDEAGHHFFVRCTDTAGSFYFGGTEASTGLLRGISINATGSPTDGSIWQKDQWHSIMISVNGNQATSPQTSVVTIWADGVEVYSGGYTVGYTESNQPQWNPMGYSAASRVYAGFGPSGGGFTKGGLDCYLSYVWCAETALDPAVYWSKFFDSNNKPKWIGAQGEDVYGTIPASYFPHGNFTDNLGSGPNWTEVGTVADAPSSPSD